MLQKAGGSFRTAPFTSGLWANQQPNMIDLYLIEDFADEGWTYGATLIDAPSLQPPALSSQWSLLGYSITGQLSLKYSDPTHIYPSAQTYGKLGTLITAIGALSTTGGGSTGFGGPVPWQLLQPLPTDMTSSSMLWDPAQNPLPGIDMTYNGNLPPYAAPANTLQVSCALQLPEPINLAAGTILGIGIWMLPSLLSSLGGQESEIAPSVCPSLYNATYTILYDDGTTQGASIA